MRLIDADKLIQDITNTLNEWIKEMPDGECLKGNVNFAEMAKEIVRNQPTAYDVDKVVEALKLNAYDMWICEEQFDMNSPYFKDVPYKMVKLGEAIDVIKAGGIDE